MTAFLTRDFWQAEFLNIICPACRCTHSVRVKRGGTGKQQLWSWNRSLDNPSLQPAVNLWDRKDGQEVRCHFVVTQGVISFMETSTHILRGQSVPLPQVREMSA